MNDKTKEKDKVKDKEPKPEQKVENTYPYNPHGNPSDKDWSIKKSYDYY